MPVYVCMCVRLRATGAVVYLESVPLELNGTLFDDVVHHQHRRLLLGVAVQSGREEIQHLVRGT